LPPAVIHEIEQQRTRLAGIVLPAAIDPSQAQAAHRAIAGAFVAGFRHVMAWCAGLALLSALCAAWFIGRDGRTR
jgi:hypothetical protein